MVMKAHVLRSAVGGGAGKRIVQRDYVNGCGKLAVKVFFLVFFCDEFHLEFFYFFFITSRPLGRCAVLRRKPCFKIRKENAGLYVQRLDDGVEPGDGAAFCIKEVA